MPIFEPTVLRPKSKIVNARSNILDDQPETEIEQSIDIFNASYVRAYNEENSRFGQAVRGTNTRFLLGDGVGANGALNTTIVMGTTLPHAAYEVFVSIDARLGNAHTTLHVGYDLRTTTQFRVLWNTDNLAPPYVGLLHQQEFWWLVIY